LVWRESSLLEVIVPNRTDFAYRAEKAGVEVRVVYSNDDPKDRAAWIARMEDRIKRHPGRE
jgi:hypothetical protein